MIDWEQVEGAALGAIVEAMDRGSARMAERARELAPVRKVFGGQDKNYRVRLKSIHEIEADRDIRRRLGLGPERLHIMPPTIVVQRAPQMLGRQRQVASPGQLRLPSAQARLDRRGRYELKTMRAVHEGQLGGHLRDRIHSVAASLEGKIIRASVVSPAPYSKFQEMGTAHNPAHPFLRPAGHEGREPLKADVARSVVAAVLPRMSGRIEVEIKTRYRGG